MNQINVVTIGKLIEAHRDGDEQNKLRGRSSATATKAHGELCTTYHCI